MAPPISNRWTTDPEYSDLLNYLVEKTKDAKSPMHIDPLAKEFKEKSGDARTVRSLRHRIEKMRTHIHGFEHIDTNTKVKLIFALSASVSANFLIELKKDALVEVDGKKRITYYKANDGSLELRGNRSQSRRVEPEQSLILMINNYFQNKNDPNAVPKNKKKREMWNLTELITEKCENVKSPLSSGRLAIDFNKKFGMTRSLVCIYRRLRRYCRVIQKVEILDTHSKVRQLFGLSVKLDSDYLEKLRTDALVETDEKNRITYYKAKNGSLELRGDHSFSAKNTTAMYESRITYRSLIIVYFENKNKADSVPMNKEAREMGNLIEFITEKCENVDFPLKINRLAKDFKQDFGMTVLPETIRKRIESYCREIRKADFLDTQTKVKQLFGLSVKLDSDYLKELRKNACVEVDEKNRIIRYKANDGSLTLRGTHWGSGGTRPRRFEKTDKKNMVATSDDSEGEGDNEGLADSSDEYSSEEFDSEFDSDEENDDLDETEDIMQPSTFEKETPVRNRSSTDMTIDDNLGFDSPTKRSHRSDEIKTRKDEEKNSKTTEIATIKTRSGRLSKRRHLDSNFSYDLANSSSSGAFIRFSSAEKTRKNSYPTAATPKKKRNEGATESSSSERTESFSNNSMRPNELDDYDINYSFDDRVKLEPFRGSIQEDMKEIVEDEDIQQIPRPIQSLDGHCKNEETTIKVEQEEPVGVKPETSHNSKIKFFEAIQSLILCLDTPSLSSIQSKIHQKIQEINKSHEGILNNEIVWITDQLIARIINHTVENIPENMESMNLSNFYCYLKAAILNSRMSGVEDLVRIISELIEESQNKRIPMGRVANALLATLDIDDF